MIDPSRLARPPANRAVQAHVGTFIFRACPFHLAHLKNVEKALDTCENVVLVPGSAWAARRWDILPWTHQERIEMIKRCLTPDQLSRITFMPQIDHANMTSWASEVREGVTTIARNLGYRDPKIALVGHKKDKPTGYYISQFQRWEAIEVDNFRGLNATPIRDRYFQPDLDGVKDYLASGEVAEMLPEGTIEFLFNFLDTPAYAELLAEKTFMLDYLKGFYDPEEIALARLEKRRPNCAPYPPTFFTVDNVVIQGDSVLLVLRGSRPCKDMWALPGGHLQDEDAFGSALNELREETMLKVPEATLRNSMIGTRTYSDALRSTRKRSITQAFFYHLTPSTRGLTDIEEIKKALALPKVKGGDDAKFADWFPISKVLSPEFRSMIMEDHWKMIQDAVAMIHQQH
jgi:bifunctional NMN adenylyltransferase/nudix hydrolase